RIEEVHVRLAKVPTRCDRLVAIALDLARVEPRHANGRGNDKEDHQVELRGNRVSPPAQRAGQYPGNRAQQSLLQQRKSLIAGPLLLVWRIRRNPEEIVTVETAVPVLAGDRRGQRRRAASRRAKDVDAIRQLHSRLSF